MKSCKTLREFLSENFANSSNEAGDWRYYTFQYASSCLELRALVPALSGVYRIYPWRDRQRPLDVFCDMRTDGGGWTVIQRRTYGIPFNRAWNEYKRGFGSKDREYWLGNDLIHALTVERTTSLYIAITLTNGTTLYEQYEQFYITDETDGYRLRIAGNTEGTLGDSLRDDWPPWNVNGMQFSTFDRDNDGFSDGKCSDSGGWWFNQCGWTYLNSDDDEARLWVPTVPNRTLVHETKMMIR
ncbi:fibroleukin-like [Saccostrea cucullata]|uniref:fibroleukin-like n=1 Tax=Saccostrea cuccullata TaxID=36930 RepID=UPI002ED30E68